MKIIDIPADIAGACRFIDESEQMITNAKIVGRLWVNMDELTILNRGFIHVRIKTG